MYHHQNRDYVNSEFLDLDDQFEISYDEEYPW